MCADGSTKLRAYKFSNIIKDLLTEYSENSSGLNNELLQVSSSPVFPTFCTFRYGSSGSGDGKMD